MAKEKTVRRSSVKKEKAPVNSRLPILSIILFSILVLLGLLVVRNRIAEKEYQMMKQHIEEETSNNLDTENDGVYYDYTYGFMFTYPKETFIVQRYPKNPGQMFWYVSESDSQSAFPEGEWLSLHVNEGERVNDFNTMYNEPVGKKNKEFSTIKLQEFDLDLGRGMLYTFDKTNSIKTSVPAYQYHAAWEIEGNTVWLTLNMEKPDTGEKFEKIFRDIATSFIFTN